jgi:tetratricopeptide (TPR) repeat protein
MTRDNIVFTTCGLVLGLIIGSFLVGPRLAKVPQLAPQPVVAAPQQQPPAANQNQMELVRQQLDALKQKIAANPNDFESLVQLGNMYADVAKYPQAIEYYERALGIRDDTNVRTDLGICYKETGRLDDAHAQFEKIVSETPDSWQALYNLIIIDGQMKKFDEAKRELAKLKQLRPNDPEVAKLEQALAQQ